MPSLQRHFSYQIIKRKEQKVFIDILFGGSWEKQTKLKTKLAGFLKKNLPIR